MTVDWETILMRPDGVLSVAVACLAAVTAAQALAHADRSGRRRADPLRSRWSRIESAAGRIYACLRPVEWNIVCFGALFYALAGATILGVMRRSAGLGLAWSRAADTPSAAAASGIRLLLADDRITQTAAWLVPLAGLACLLMVRRRRIARWRPCESLLVGVVLLAAMTAAAAADLVVLWAAVEVGALADHALAMRAVRGRVRRKALHQQLLGATVASAALLLGCAILFAVGRTTGLTLLYERLATLATAETASVASWAARAGLVLFLGAGLWRVQTAGLPLQHLGGTPERRWPRRAMAALVVQTTPLVAAGRIATALPPDLLRFAALVVSLPAAAMAIYAWSRLARAAGPREALSPLSLGLCGSMTLIAAVGVLWTSAVAPALITTLAGGYIATIVAWSAMTDLLGSHHTGRDAAAHWETLAGAGRTVGAGYRAITVGWLTAWAVALGLPPRATFWAWQHVVAGWLAAAPETGPCLRFAAGLLLLACYACLAILALRVIRIPWRLPLKRVPLIDDPVDRRRRIMVIVAASVLALVVLL